MNKLPRTNKTLSSKVGMFYLIALLLFIIALFCQLAIGLPIRIPIVDVSFIVIATLLGTIHIRTHFLKKQRKEKIYIGGLILGILWLIFGVIQAGEIILNIKGDSRILSAVGFIFSALVATLIFVSTLQGHPLFVYEYDKPRSKVRRRLEKIFSIICLVMLILWVFIVFFLPLILERIM